MSKKKRFTAGCMASFPESIAQCDPMPARPKGQIHEIEIDPSDIIIVKVKIHPKAVSETKIWSESHGIARKSTGEMYHWSDFKHKAVQKEWDDEPLMRY